MSEKETGYTKIGEGHASAMWRQGLSELRGAMYPESNVAQPPQYGLYGTRTPGEVAEARRPDDRDMDEEKGQKSVIEDRLQQAEMSVQRDQVKEMQKEPEPEKEIER
jgi:hypothetical protein